MTMAQKTAVEWLIDQLKGRYDIDIEKLMVCAAAKEIEKEQIEGAYIKGGVFQFDKDKEAEQYYNETYNK